MVRLVAALARLALAVPGRVGILEVRPADLWATGSSLRRRTTSPTALRRVPDGGRADAPRPRREPQRHHQNWSGRRSTPSPRHTSCRRATPSSPSTARGHGDSGGLVSVDGPREIQDVRELVGFGSQQRSSVSAPSATPTEAARSGRPRLKACRSPRSKWRPRGPTSTPRSSPEPRPLRNRARLLAIDCRESGSRGRADPERRARRPEPRRGAGVRRPRGRRRSCSVRSRRRRSCSRVGETSRSTSSRHSSPCAPQGPKRLTSATSGTPHPRVRPGELATSSLRRAPGSTGS